MKRIRVTGEHCRLICDGRVSEDGIMGGSYLIEYNGQKLLSRFCFLEEGWSDLAEIKSIRRGLEDIVNSLGLKKKELKQLKVEILTDSKNVIGFMDRDEARDLLTNIEKHKIDHLRQNFGLSFVRHVPRSFMVRRLGH